MTIPDPAAQNFQVDDLTLPKSLAPAAVENRRSFLNVIDRHYRDSVKSVEHAKMDAFRQKAWEMILTPGVRDGFRPFQRIGQNKRYLWTGYGGSEPAAGAPAGRSRNPLCHCRRLPRQFLGHAFG